MFMLEQCETNEYWLAVGSHRRGLQYQPGLLVFMELEVLVKASFGIVFSHCPIYLKNGGVGQNYFFLAVKGRG